MVSNRDEWIRIFDIPDTSKHKNGFTIYKVVSMLYPESCPDAVTKVTVWKRFNDFKQLHREIKVLHRKLGLKDKLPSMPSNALFKRFDDETIKYRKLGILQFLEFIAKHSQLFTSNVFVKFLEVSHTPVKHLNSNINLIRADLNLPEDPEVSAILTSNSDDERTISDTDSISTIGSLTAQGHDTFTDINQKGTRNLKRLPSTYSIDSQSSRASETYSIATSIDTMQLLDNNQIYPTPPTTPSGSSIVGDNVQYLIDASIHVNLALELESDRKYEEAFAAYKTAIDILIKYGKDDSNYDRRQMVSYKTEKYLIRAGKILNMYLVTPVIRDLQISTPIETSQPTLLGDLYKFKVIRIISSGMLVLHSDLQQLFYIKVVHKTMEFLNEHLILPENVPYMVKLHNHYNRENDLFLLLEYRSCTRLSDYIKNGTTDELNFTKDQQILKQIQEYSDNESELSYSELINDYTNNRTTDKENVYVETETKEYSSDDSFEKVDMRDVLFSSKKKLSLPVKNIMDEPLEVVKKPPRIPSTNKTLEDICTPFISSNNILLDNVGAFGLSNHSESKILSPKNENTNSGITEFDTERLHETEIDTGKSGKTDIDTVKESLRGARLRGASRRKSSEMSTFSCEDLEFDRSLLVPEETVVKWAAQLLLALEKLHALGIICRDLQTKNVLIDENNDLVLTYMCNIKDLCDLYSNGVNINLAPEVYSYSPVTEAVDWWSYGAILYEILVGMPLSDIHVKGITSYTHIKIPRYISPEARSLLRQLLTYNPHERLGSGLHGTENIKSHPFFSSVSWESLFSKYKKL